MSGDTQDQLGSRSLSFLCVRQHEYDHGYEHGADDFIAKPFDQSVLIAKVQALLRHAYTFSVGMPILEHAGAIINLYVLSLSDYNRITGNNAELADAEALLYAGNLSYKKDTLTIGDHSFRIRKIHSDKESDISNSSSFLLVPTVYLILSDPYTELQFLLTEKAGNDSDLCTTIWQYNFDIDNASPEMQTQIMESLRKTCADLSEDEDMVPFFYTCLSPIEARNDFYASYGGLFFLGIMLSILFLVATVLIIYFKQVSEGYEDQARFTIMQYVGMTKPDIRKSTNAQMLTVFFLPLLFAVLHLSFAFPMIRKLLYLFSLNNLPLLLTTTGISVLVFTVFYAVVYRITSNIYFTIVSRKATDET